MYEWQQEELPKKPLPDAVYKVLCCPKDKAVLKANKDKTMLICTKCHKEYPVDDGVPVFTS